MLGAFWRDPVGVGFALLWLALRFVFGLLWIGGCLMADTLVLLGRYLSGRPLDGVPRTDARFLRSGTRALTQTGHASRWSYLPGWKRALWRVVPPALLLAAAVGYVLAPGWTLAVLVLLGAAGTWYEVWRTRRRLRARRWRRQVVRPLYGALAPMLRLPPRDPAEKWLTVPMNARDDENAVIAVTLPDEFHATAAEKAALSELVGSRIGGQWDAHFHMRTAPFRAEWRPAPAPPGMVTFGQFRAELDKASANAPVIGRGSRGKVFAVDMDHDAPHILLGMGTGGGKTNTLRGLIAQLARHRVEVDIIDPKRISLSCFRGVPGIRIHRSLDSQMMAIAEFRQEMESRYDQLDQDETAEFPRRVLVIEEMNSFTAQVRDWWGNTRSKDDPKTAPAINDLGFVLFQGRQARMNVVTALQQANARAVGGSDFRDQFGVKVLARFSPQVWGMLVGTYPRPKSSRHPGRGLVLIGDDQHTVQLAFIEPDEAREYALDGRAPVDVPPVRELPELGNRAVTVPPEGRTEVRLSLRDAAETAVPLGYDALRKARQRDPEFPAGRTVGRVTTYTPEELAAWYGNRPRAGATS